MTARPLVVAAALLAPSLAAAQPSRCRADQVEYLSPGCVYPRNLCWRTNVRPTPSEWCGCDGQTFGGTLPTRPYRFEGRCEVTATVAVLVERPAGRAPALQSLRLTLGNHALDLGRFEGACVQTTPDGEVLRVTCGADTIVVIRRESAVLISHAVATSFSPARELGTFSVPAAQRVTVAPLAPRPGMGPTEVRVQFVVGPRPGRDGRPTGESVVEFDDGHGPSFVGYFPGDCVDAAPVAPAVMRLRCAETDFTITPSGNRLTLTRQESQDGGVSRVMRRFELPSNVPVITNPTRHSQP